MYGRVKHIQSEPTKRRERVYYIGRMIKLNRSSPYMYLYYALIVTLLAVIAHNVVSKN